MMQEVCADVKMSLTCPSNAKVIPAPGAELSVTESLSLDTQGLMHFDKEDQGPEKGHVEALTPTSGEEEEMNSWEGGTSKDRGGSPSRQVDGARLAKFSEMPP